MIARASEQTPLLSAHGNHQEASHEAVHRAVHEVHEIHEETDTMAESECESKAIRRALRKVDCRLIPLLFVTYMLNFMDKTILSSASVFGLIDDTVLLFYLFILFFITQ